MVRLFALAAICLSGSLLAAPRVALVDALEWLYDDSSVASVRTVSETDIPANGVAEVNILFNGLAKDAALTVSCDAPGAEWFRLVAVPVNKNTGLTGFVEKPGITNVFVTRDAPFRVYDAMEPLTSLSLVPAAETMALRLRLRKLPFSPRPVPVTLSFKQGAFSAREKFTVNLHAAAVPPVGAKSFKYTNWMDYYTATKCQGIRSYWTAEHWAVVERMVRLAVYGRQNTVMVPLFLRKDKTGRKVPDEERIVRFVGMLDRLGVAYLEGDHLCRFSTGSWSSPTFRPIVSTNLSTSTAGTTELASLASSLYGIICRHGWRDRWYQHVADEPAAHNIAEYRTTVGVVRKYMPGIRLLDAIEIPEIGGALDAYCPKNHDYEQKQAAYEALRQCPTDEIWCYTCCYPGGKWMNRLLDHELLRALYLPWGCFRFNLDGYLHWGFNRFTPEVTPFLPSIGGNLPPGDTHIVYPGDKDSGPWPSVRLEAMRQGMEDYELLRLLAKDRPDRARAILRRLVRGFGDYTADVPLYRKTRRELLMCVGRKEATK